MLVDSRAALAAGGMRSVNFVALSLDFLVQSLALHDRSMDDKNWAKRLDVD